MKKIEDITLEEVDAEVELRIQELKDLLDRKSVLFREIAQLKRYKRTGKKPGEK